MSRKFGPPRQQQQQPPQQNPNVVVQFESKQFNFKLDTEAASSVTDIKVATDWLNNMTMAGWQLYEFNKMYQDGILLILVVVARGVERKVVTATGGIPTKLEPRTK